MEVPTFSPPCRLCENNSLFLCKNTGGQDFFLCSVCELVFLDPKHYLSREAEKERYLLHKNEEADLDYRAFLNRLWKPLSQKILPNSSGLDYGSGPNPVLSKMMHAEGHQISSYDPLFSNHLHFLKEKYAFVVCCETAEHFYSPREEFDRFQNLLRPGAWLGIQTQILDDRRKFKDWYYHRDPTHVVFYSVKTMQWIAGHYGYSVERASSHVFLFQA